MIPNSASQTSFFVPKSFYRSFLACWLDEDKIWFNCLLLLVRPNSHIFIATESTTEQRTITTWFSIWLSCKEHDERNKNNSSITKVFWIDIFISCLWSVQAALCLATILQSMIDRKLILKYISEISLLNIFLGKFRFAVF